MSFAALKSKSTDLSKLVEMGGTGPAEKQSSMMKDSGNQLEIKLVTVMLLLDFYLVMQKHLLHGLDTGSMPLKVLLVNGILRNH